MRKGGEHYFTKKGTPYKLLQKSPKGHPNKYKLCLVGAVGEKGRKTASRKMLSVTLSRTLIWKGILKGRPDRGEGKEGEGAVRRKLRRKGGAAVGGGER